MIHLRSSQLDESYRIQMNYRFEKIEKLRGTTNP